MKGAELFVRCLEKEGVQYVFGLPGEEIADLLKAISFSTRIKFVLVKQEQSASFMADVYGRLTGRAGVCVSTLGPGATNLLTGVADAFLDRAPVVAITGQGGLERTYEESHQYIDVVSVYKFVTKWNRSITRAKFIPQVVRKAFSLAQSEKTGAVHMELPEDVAMEEVQESPLEGGTNEAPSPVDAERVRIAVKLVANARFPLILAGNGVIRSRASKQLNAFAKRFGVPVANTFMGKGVISAKDTLSIGTIGLQTRDLVNCVFEKADLIIAVGYDFVELAPKFWNVSEDKKMKKTIIHIDSEAAETDQYYNTTLELVGDICATLELLIAEQKALPSNNSVSNYIAKISSMIEEELLTLASDDSFPVKPQRIIYELRQALQAEDIVISDVGMHKTWISRLYPAYAPNTVIISNGFASMGISIPGAIAAKLARPERNVVAVCGDGAFMMSLHELETAKRLNTKFTIVLFDDGEYSQIAWRQKAKFGESYFTKFNNPDFVKLAESFGWYGVKIESAKELPATLKKAISSKESWIIDVPVDSGENTRLLSRLGSNLVCPSE